MDDETRSLLNGDRATSVLKRWAREGDVDRLADAATCSEVNYGSRFFAVRYLGDFDDELSVSALVAALNDQDDRVRAQAARSLRALGSLAQAAVPALTNALSDSDGSVRVAAARALGTLGDRSAIPALLRVVETNSWHTLHSWATNSLAQLGAQEAEPHLLQHLEDDKAWQRRSAARMLGEVGGESTIEAVRRARRRDPLHREVYTRAIRAIEGRGSPPTH